MSPARRIGIGVALLLAAAAIAASRVGGLQGTRPEGTTAARPAPELAGIEAWINGEPTTLAALRGRVVLLDFWTFSCVNCVRTFPHLRALHDRYAAHGLEIIGVHAPEFEFERDIGEVRAAVSRHGLPYRVALDNEMETWRAYRNNYWPRVYVIDATGSIRFDHIGEGGEDQIQSVVRGLLEEAGRSPLPDAVLFDRTGPSPHITPEIYAGHERGSIQGSLGNPEGYVPGSVVRYAPVTDEAVARAGTSGTFFLEGAWASDREFVESVGAAAVVLPFFARDVFMVAAAPGGSVGARVELDGVPVPSAVAGDDAAEGVVVVDRSDLFRLIGLEQPASHVVRIEVPAGFRLYTFTFG